MGNNISDLKEPIHTNNLDPLSLGSHSIVNFNESYDTNNHSKMHQHHQQHKHQHQYNNSNINSTNDERLNISRKDRFEGAPTSEFIEHIENFATSSDSSSYMSDCSSCKNYYHNQHVESLEFEKKHHPKEQQERNYTHDHRTASSSPSPPPPSQKRHRHRHSHHHEGDHFNNVLSDGQTEDDTNMNESGLELRRFSNVHPGYEDLPVDNTNKSFINSNNSSTNNRDVNMDDIHPPSLERKDTDKNDNSINTSGYSSRNISVSFFSDTNQDAAHYDHAIDEFKNKRQQEKQQSQKQSQKQNVDSADVQSYKSGFIDEFTSPSPQEKQVYTTDIPVFYIPERIRYPYRSPYEYTDSEFDLLNHFDFLKSLNFKEPPLLPPYLSSNLLNDSSSHNYKTYPYQYQQSNELYVNDQYHYNINNLHIMDKYSQPPRRKSSARSASVSSKKDYSILNNSSSRKQSIANNDADVDMDLDLENNQNPKSDIPNHVMLNHLITCNLKNDMNAVMTGSCIHRYGGKFITQIMYFSTEIANS